MGWKDRAQKVEPQSKGWRGRAKSIAPTGPKPGVEFRAAGEGLEKLLGYANYPWGVASTGAVGMGDVGAELAKYAASLGEKGEPGKAFDMSFDEMGKALSNEAVDPMEMLKKRGIQDSKIQSTQFPMSILDQFGVTPLRAAVFAAEMAGDPLNAAKILKPFSTATALKKGGKKLFKSAFKEADILAKRAGVAPLSELAWKNKKEFSGTSKGIAKRADEYYKGLKQARATEVLDVVDDSGAKGSIRRAMAPVQEQVDSWVAEGSGVRARTAKKFQKKINDEIVRGERAATPAVPAHIVKKKTPLFDLIKKVPEKKAVPGKPGPTVSKLTQLKTDLYEGINWQDTNKLDNRLRKTMARGTKEEAERVADSVGLGDRLRGIHGEMGTLGATIKKVKQVGEKSDAGKKLLSPWRMFLMSINPKAGALMSGADILSFPATKTMGGRGMFRLGEEGKNFIPALERRSLINLGKEEK